MSVRWALIAVVALSACTRAQFNAGGSCSLNTDCAEPLVCGLERCRRQCADSRDCGAGLMCLQIGETGVCQLPEESHCAISSDCTRGLACRFGTCTTECAEDRDCPPDAMCRLDESDGASACVEARELCVYNSDCWDGDGGLPLVCGPDQRCRLECLMDEDCDRLRYCDTTRYRCMPRDAGL